MIKWTDMEMSWKTTKMQKTCPVCICSVYLFIFIGSLFLVMSFFLLFWDIHRETNMGFLKAESSDWQGAHPGRVPTRRCGDVSLPFAAQGLGLAGRGQGVESRLAGLEEGDPGSSQRCLKYHKRKINNWLNRLYHCLSYMVELFYLCITSTQLCARWRGPGCWWGSGWSQLVMGEQVVQLGRA